MPTDAKVVLIFLFVLLPAEAFSLVASASAQVRDRSLKRQQDQIARDHDVFQCRYLLGLLDQEWSPAYSSGNAQPSKDTIKHLRKDAGTAEKAVARLMIDLDGAKPSTKPDGSALAANVPSDFISTLHRVISELNTFAHVAITDAAEEKSLLADLRLLGILLNRFDHGQRLPTTLGAGQESHKSIH